MSGCRSFGSNYQACSQSRKVSIGIIVYSFSKSKPDNSKRNEEAVVVPENEKPSQGNSMVNGDHRKLNADITNSMEKRLESSGKKNSTWVSPKSVYQKLAVPSPVRSGF
ncbi:hypothetical protein LIER_44096 [Lithospermum erythrorhizon]|uniref:Meiosis-specific protein ASY3-like coiled-coil domain-containing protein n=1 Tax=Lithospermum erythrorhizon TaxID=34254 RepID=A0AAV3PIW8_LITER